MLPVKIAADVEFAATSPAKVVHDPKAPEWIAPATVDTICCHTHGKQESTRPQARRLIQVGSDPRTPEDRHEANGHRQEALLHAGPRLQREGAPRRRSREARSRPPAQG